MTMRQKMNLALDHYSSGRLRDTEGLCHEILGIDAQHAEALHLLGVLAHRAGNVDAVVDLGRRAIASNPSAALSAVIEFAASRLSVCGSALSGHGS